MHLGVEGFTLTCEGIRNPEPPLPGDLEFWD